MENKWNVKIARIEDLNKWFKFVKNVIHDFYDIDLVNDESYKKAVEKNIKRKTAIYVEEKDKIIGGMLFSPNSNQIGWLAVDPDYRRKGIGTLLVKYMLKELEDRKEHWQSKASHPFYKSLGFEPKEISYENMENNANNPMLIFIRKNVKEE